MLGYSDFPNPVCGIRKPNLPGLGKLELPRYLLNPHRAFTEAFPWLETEPTTKNKTKVYIKNTDPRFDNQKLL